MQIVNIVMLVASCVLLAPVAIFCAECLAALAPRSKRLKERRDERPSVAVLVPAHNEEMVIQETLASLAPQLRAGDRAIVIADNCDDATAQTAQSAGAEVIVRTDQTRRGKGYALDCGVRHLAKSPPAVVLMLDADCRIEPGALHALALQVIETARPAQAVYLMDTPSEPSARDAISALAFTFKNLVRPAGLDRLAGVCLLTGTGMAIPWSLLSVLNLATGNIVEDMQLGLDAARAGSAPRLCRDARVTGSLPIDSAAATSQRTRWEHGHLRTIIIQSPRLLIHGLIERKFSLIALALDLVVPPLSLLVMALLAMSLAAAALAANGAWLAPLGLLVVGLTMLSLCVMAGWARFARDRVPLRSLAAIPQYLLWKAPLLLAFLLKPQRAWVRTGRDAEATGGQEASR